jgi:branched-chain amino acid transport system substrate-binding protein
MFLLPGMAVSADKKPYKIGANLELTGPWANVTNTLKMAMDMEVERINAKGGVDGHPIELVYEDNGFDVSKVSVNMLKFVRDKDFLAAVGPFEDNFQATSRAIAEREGLTNIIVCPSNPKVRSLKQKWSFNIAHNDIVVSEKLVDLCLLRGHKKVLVFAGAWPLAQSLAKNFKSIGEEKGIKVIISEQTHKPTDIDMSPQLIKIKPVLEKESVNAIYLATGGPPGPIICKNMKTLGLELPVLGTHAFGFGFILHIGGAAMEGVEFPTGKPVVPYQLDKDDPARQSIVEFHERMKAKYGVGADQVSGHGYDIVWLIYDALKRCGGKVNRANFRTAFENTKDFKGCTGIFNYSPTDHEGLDKDDMVLVRIEGGKFVRIVQH